jgi:hypothetical protein
MANSIHDEYTTRHEQLSRITDTYRDLYRHLSLKGWEGGRRKNASSPETLASTAQIKGSASQILSGAVGGTNPPQGLYLSIR